jgi:hypothetical protein
MADLIDSLIKYVNDIKPFHTKIFGVEVEYRYNEHVAVTITDSLKMNVGFGVPIESYSVIEGPWEYQLNGITRYGRWDESQFDMYPFDTSTEQLVPAAGRMSDQVYVSFSEKLEFSVDIIGIDAPDQYTYVNTWWDPDTDGIKIVESTRNSFVVLGNSVSMFRMLPVIRVFDTSINDGVYTVVTAEYDVERNMTYVIVNATLHVMGGNIGKIAVSYYDHTEWDGDSSVLVVQPKADAYAKSTFGEMFSIMSGYGWDDPNMLWDSPTALYDDAAYLLKGTSGKKYTGGWEYLNWDQDYPWDSDGYLPGDKYDAAGFDNTAWDADQVAMPHIDDSVGVIAFSAENMPMPSVYQPTP